jgi:methyl-accepting chemotaxis protein
VVICGPWFPAAQSEGGVMKPSHGVLGRFSNLSIAKKLALGFATLAVGLVAVVIVGANGMSSMTATHNDVVNVGAAKQLLSQDARGAAADMHFSQTLYVLDGGAKRPDYLVDRQKYQTAFDRLRAISSDAMDKPLIDAISAATTQFDNGDGSLWALVHARRNADADKLVEGAQNTAADSLTTAFTAYQKVASDDVALQTAKFKSTAASAKLTMILVGLLALLLGSGAAFVLSRSVAGRARKMLAAANGIAEGDVDQHIEVTSQDELGATASAFQRMIEYLKTMVTAAERMAQGDLSIEVTPRSERDALGNSFGAMIANLRELMGNLSQAAGGVGMASEQMTITSQETGRATGEIAHAIGDVAQGAERQVRLVEAARQAADEVAAAVKESAENAEQTAGVAARARDTAQRGVAAAEQANEAMTSVRDSSQNVSDAIRGLAGTSEQIGAIVKTITGIAEQTNLLALNAAIEAARAGEQGRGFAVVAEEVRKLAEESRHAAQEISQLISAIQGETTKTVAVVEDGARKTAEGATVVEQTREAFLSIGAAVDDIAGRVEQIAAAAEQITASATSMQESIGEVASVAEESSAATEEVSASTEQTSASAQEIAASAQELSSSAEGLNRLVAQFKLVS